MVSWCGAAWATLDFDPPSSTSLTSSLCQRGVTSPTSLARDAGPGSLGARIWEGLPLSTQAFAIHKCNSSPPQFVVDLGCPNRYIKSIKFRTLLTAQVWLAFQLGAWLIILNLENISQHITTDMRPHCFLAVQVEDTSPVYSLPVQSQHSTKGDYKR